MNTFPTIYKRTNTGKIQIWYAEQDGALYRTTSGQLDGKLVTTNWTEALPKNQGRANATTAEQQATSEINSEYSKKLAKDYKESIDDVDTKSRYVPMTAHKWKDHHNSIRNEDVIFIQPKLDGLRNILKSDGMWSREGKPLYGATHIFEEMQSLLKTYPDLIFDGELYNHDLKDDFNTIVSCVRKQKISQDDYNKSLELIQYWIYDLPSFPGTFKQRHEELKRLIPQDTKFIKVVETLTTSKSDVDSIATDYISQGFEGAMVRTNDHYQQKRSKFLLKWKEFQDEEFEIVDIQEGDGNRSNMAARVVLKMKDNKTFSAGLIGNVDYCRKLLLNKHKHIGKQGTVIFQNYTPDGIPRFPKFKTVRDYE